MTGAALTVRPGSELERGSAAAGALALAYIARHRSDAGRAAARWRLDVAARVLSAGRGADALTYPWHALTGAHVAALAAAMAGGTGRGRPYGPRTCNAVLAAVRGVTREAWRAGMLEADALARLWDGVRPEPLPTVRAGRYVEPAERDALWAAAAGDALTMRGARDAALLAMLDGGGLRASEAAGAAWDGADLERGALTVRGKGRKLRRVALDPADRDALADWRAALELAGALELDADGRAAGAILRSVDRHGNAGGPLAVRGVARALDRLAAATGGTCGPLTPHDLRRSYVSDLLDAGADVSTVSGMAGHSNVTTTAGYDRRGERAMVAAARLRPRPYVRRERAA